MRYNIIKTEKYFLICDDSEIKGSYSYHIPTRLVLNLNNDFSKKIIAHLPLNEAPYLDGVDVLPSLEDDVEELAKQELPISVLGESIENKREWNGFKKGYQKAREKYKFTEDDMIKFADFKSSNLMKHSDENGMYLGTRKVLELWKSLQQPKYPIAFDCEMEFYRVNHAQGLKPIGHPLMDVAIMQNYKPKIIINSEGRVEWVGKYIYE